MRIEISVTNYPQKEIYAVCRDCGAEIWREKWDTYADYNNKKRLARKLYKKCPHCGVSGTKSDGQAPKVKWEKHIDIYGYVTKNWEAKLEDGDFLVWKDGKIWKARWRVYGSDDPIMLGFASTLEAIKARCEHSKYWTKGESV